MGCPPVMPDSKPIVDFRQESTWRQLALKSPILSSHKAGWNAIQLAYLRQSACELAECCFAQHIVSIYVGQPGIKLRVNGRFQSEYSADGDIDIFPASESLKIGWDGESEVIHLYLEPTAFARVAYESIDGSCIELVPQFRLRDPLIQQIGLALKTELESGGEDSRLYAESMATALSVHLMQRYSTRKQVLQNYTGGLPQYKLREAIAYINDHLDQKLTLAELAAVVQMSPHYFANLFKQSTGLSPHQYVTQYRIERAKRLLRRQDLTIVEICQQVGFQNQSHFTTVFRQHTTTTPKAYRDSL